MNKHLLSLIGVLICCINAYAVEFKARIIDESKKTCAITHLAGPEDYLVNGTLAIPSYVVINNYPYGVASVDKYALDDLLFVTKIILPQALTSIGDASESNPTGNLHNFNNCPKLETFEVAKSNSVFSSTSDGLLTAGTGGKILVRVPAALKVSNSQYSLPSTITTLGASAFTDVSTISKLILGPVKEYTGNCGLNDMPWLSEIAVSDSKSILKSNNGILTDPTKGVLISFPARMMLGSLSIPSSITKIGERAFANAIYLSNITSFTSVTEIGKAAFRNSRIRSLNLPSSLKSIDAFAFASCPELTNLNFRGKLEKLPPHMAKGSSKLAAVTYQAGLPKAIGNGAFANCTALTKHPFSNFELGDSAFANTGFETVVFDNASLIDNPVSRHSGEAAFADCKNLTKIDISALGTSPEARFNAGSFFASNCPKLTEILFPSYSYFYQIYGNSDNQASAVVNNPRLNKIILGCWLTGGGFSQEPVFSLSPVKPDIFLKVDGLVGSAEFAVPVAGDFVSNDGSTFKPIFYWEAPYVPASDYVINGASYYVPGGALDRFSAATDAGCYVEEFYRFQLSTVNNGLVISIKEIFPEMVKLKNIATDALPHVATTYGEFNTAIPPQYVKYVKVTYEVHGVEFTTTYDQDFITAASNDELNADNVSDSAPIYYDLQGIKVTNPQPGQIYIVKHNGHTYKTAL